MRNSGSLPATNVRLGHIQLPDFSIFPARQFYVEPLMGGGKEVVFPNMVPGEQITINYLYFAPLLYSQINTYVKSDEGYAQIVTALPTPQRSKLSERVVIFLCAAGCLSIIYFLTQAFKIYL